MTSLQERTFSHQEVTTGEDPMELTSDLDNRLTADDDIDINLDLEQDNLEDLEDEYMVEDTSLAVGPDGSGEASRNVNDDEMIDEEYPSNLSEDIASNKYEDLEDTDYPIQDDGLHEIAQNVSHGVPQPSPQDLEQNPRKQSSDQDLLSSLYDDEQVSDIAHGEESSLQIRADSQGLEPLFEDGHVTGEFFDEVANQEGEVESANPLIDSRSEGDDDGEEDQSRNGRTHEDVPNEVNQDLEETSQSKYAEELMSTLRVPRLSGKGNVEVDLNDHSQENLEKNTKSGGDTSAPESRNTHPIVVTYEDNEMLLFPPVGQDTAHSQMFLLEDESLIHENFSQLFEACRQVLASSISDQDELEFEMKSLNLCISENSKHTSRYGLAQILDTYLQLHRADGLDNPEPFHMTLYTKTRFTSRFESLISAVNKGLGFSQIRLSQEYENEAEVEYDEGGEDESEAIGEDQAGNQTTADEGSEQDHGSITDEQNQQDNFQSSPKELETPSAAPAEIEQAIQPNERHSTSNNNEAIENNFSARTDEADIEDGDLIDFEDHIDSIYKSSTTSSTIQGDGSEGLMNDLTNERIFQDSHPNLATAGITFDNTAKESSRESDEHSPGIVDHQSLSEADRNTRELSSKGGSVTPKIFEEDEQLHAQQVNASSNESYITLNQAHEINPGKQTEKDGSVDTFQSTRDLSAPEIIENGSPIDTTPGVWAFEQSLEIVGENLQDPCKVSQMLDDQTVDSAKEADNDDAYRQRNTDNTFSSFVGSTLQRTEESNVPENFDLDNDEITYEDDENTEVTAKIENEAKARFDVGTVNSPGSLKRGRVSDEEDSPEDNEQDLKRVRS